eukprot:746152-Hanusia_phi.AAC.13
MLAVRPSTSPHRTKKEERLLPWTKTLPGSAPSCRLSSPMLTLISFISTLPARCMTSVYHDRLATCTPSTPNPTVIPLAPLPPPKPSFLLIFVLIYEFFLAPACLFMFNFCLLVMLLLLFFSALRLIETCNRSPLDVPIHSTEPVRHVGASSAPSRLGTTSGPSGGVTLLDQNAMEKKQGEREKRAGARKLPFGQGAGRRMGH